MRYLRIFAATGLAGLTLALAGCGGDDEPSIDDIVNSLSTTTSTTGTTATMTEGEVIAAGDAVCAEANAAIANMTESADPAIAADQVRSITEGMHDDLRSLDPPSGGRSDFNDMVSAIGDQIDALERRASTSRAADDAGYQLAGVDLDAARAEAQSAGEAYGFESCGQPFDAIPADGGAGTDSGGTGAPGTPTTTPTTPTTPEAPPSAGGGTGAPGGTPGDAGGDTGGDDGGDTGGTSGSGGISPG